MLAFRSLDPFRALREPDRRRRDEERLSRSEQRTLSKTQNNHLTGKAPYKFEPGLLQRRVCEPSVLLDGIPRTRSTRPRLDVTEQQQNDDDQEQEPGYGFAALESRQASALARGAGDPVVENLRAIGSHQS